MSTCRTVSQIARPPSAATHTTLPSYAAKQPLQRATNGAGRRSSSAISSSSSSTTTHDSLVSSSTSLSTSISSSDEPMPLALQPPVPQASTAHLAIGTRVIVPSLCVIGTLRFLGETQFKPGTWAGIELDVEGAGKNDGCIQGVRYFSCPDHTGLFVPANKASPLPSGMEDDDLDVKIEPHARPPAAAAAAAAATAATTSSSTARAKHCCSGKRHAGSAAAATSAAAPPLPAPKHACATMQKSKSSSTNSTAAHRSGGSTVRRSAQPSSSKSTSTKQQQQQLRKSTVPSRATGAVRRASEGSVLRKTSVPQQHHRPITPVRKTAVPSGSKSTLTRPANARRNSEQTVRTVGALAPARKSAVPSSATIAPPRAPTASRSTTTASRLSLRDQRRASAGTPAAAAAPGAGAVPMKTSRSTTTRRTKHTVHKTTASAAEEQERLRRLLEESRREHEKLCLEMSGKEAAWERVVSSKESYAVQVQDQKKEIERLQRAMHALEAERDQQQRVLASAKAHEDQKHTIDQQQQRIERLDRHLQEMQAKHADEQQARHAEQQQHRALVQQLRDALAERDRQTAFLENGYQDLKLTEADAQRRWEASARDMEARHAKALADKDAHIAALTASLDEHRQQLMLLPHEVHDHEDSASMDRRRRLEHQLQLATAELDRERSEKHAAMADVDRLTAQMQQMQHASGELHRQMAVLQHKLDAEIRDKRRTMDDASTTLAKMTRLQDQHDQMALAKNRIEHDLADAIRRASALETILQQQAVDRSNGRDSLEAENARLLHRLAELEKPSALRRFSGGPQSPVSPVSLTSFSSLLATATTQQQQHPHDEDHLYCEICEVFGHDVMGCTAYLTTAPAGSDYADHPLDSELSSSYCVNCDVFGAHSTEDCPNQDEMF